MVKRTQTSLGFRAFGGVGILPEVRAGFGAILLVL